MSTQIPAKSTHPAIEKALQTKVKSRREVFKEGLKALSVQLRASPSPIYFGNPNHCHQDKLIKAAVCACQPIPIRAKSNFTVLIDKSGSYKLCNNIRFKATSNGPTAAIFITANNVTLDLGGWTIQQANGINNSPIDGIFVTGVQNVKIFNGTVRDFSRAGIRIQNSSDIQIDQISAINNGPINGQPFSNNDIGIGGLLLIDTTNVVVSRSQFLQNVFMGIGGDGVRNVVVTQIQSNETRGLATTLIFGNSAFGLGFTLQNVPPLNSPNAEHNIVVKQSTFNGTQGGDSAFGIFIATLAEFGEPRSNGLLIEDVEIHDSQSTNKVTDVAFGTFTFGITTSADTVTYRRVQVSNIFNNVPVTSHGVPNASQIQGIEGSGNNGLLVEDCQVGNLRGSSDAQPLAAFDVEGPLANITIRNNVVQNLRAVSGVGHMPGVGFLITERTGAPALDVICPGALVEKNTAQGISDFGFWIEALQGALIQRNVSENNGTAGFLFYDTLPGVVSSGVVVQKNSAIGNGAFGFINMNADVRFAFIQNLARSNPTNYSGIPVDTIVVYNPPAGPLPPTPSKFVNLSITPGVIVP